MNNKIKITIVGAGYVGLSLATLLSRTNEVTVLEKDETRVNKINQRISYLEDEGLKKAFTEDKLYISATSNKKTAYDNSDFVILSVPTNFDEKINSFDTSILNNCIKDIFLINKKTKIFIKSTVPIGFVERMRLKYKTKNIYFSPEFLREGYAVFDNIKPARIVVGGNDEYSKEFANLLLSISDNNPEIIITGNSEAEAIKLFSNTYLAMRVAFFNELDTYAMSNDLDSLKIINGIGLDERIGNIYNNPSFGYGGYCLPKDSKQLRTQFKNVPNSVINSIVDSNDIRKDFLVESILSKASSTIGIFRLIMKEGSDNFREAAILDIIFKIKEKGKEVIIYEPFMNNDFYEGIRVVESLKEFKKLSSVIVANRYEACLDDVRDKVFTRDKFSNK